MKTKTKLTGSWKIIPIFMVCLFAMTFSGYPIQDVNKKEILKQQYRVKKQLHPATKKKAAQLIQALENQLSSSDMDDNPSLIASEIIRSQFEDLSPPEIEILSFHLLCEVANDLEDDIRLIMGEIEAMNRAKQKLRELIEDFNEWIEERMKSSTLASDIDETPAQEKEPPPVLKEYTDMAETPHFKAKYPKSPEIIYSKDPEKMSLSELDTDLNRIKTALNSVHKISETGIKALEKEMDRRTKFLQTLSNLSERISNIQDTLIRNIK